MKHQQVAVIGCGLGGATMTALLQRAGYDAAVFAQAPAFGPVGAGIHLSPHPMHVMRFLELDDVLVNCGFRPGAFTSRTFDTAEIRHELPLRERYAGRQRRLRVARSFSRAEAGLPPALRRRSGPMRGIMR